MNPRWLTEDAVYQLGAVVMSCRNRRRDRAFVALSGSPLLLYITLPLGAFFLTFPLAGIALWQKIPPPLLKHPVWGPILGVWFLACCIVIYRYQFTAPQEELLVLHEKGLRYRRHIIPFDDLTNIQPGLVDTWIVKSSNWLNRSTGQRSFTLFEGDRIAEAARRASVTLYLKERRPLALRSVLVCHFAIDLKQFFTTIASQHPELLAARDLDAILGFLHGQSI